MCLAKGITGGYLPLAATLATERIYEGFLGEHEEFRTFFHGHTYTGNPLACAAALATLEVFEQERTLERLQPKIELLGELLQPGRGESRRRRGPPARLHGRHRARRLPARGAHGPPGHARGPRRGAIVRPLGDVVVLMPPLAITRPTCAGWSRSPRRRSRPPVLRRRRRAAWPKRPRPSPRRARSPSCERRTPGRPSRRGCPRRRCRAGRRRRGRPLRVVDEPAGFADPLLAVAVSLMRRRD